MFLMISDSSYMHRRLSSEISEEILRSSDTRKYQKAIAKAFEFLGISCIGGFPMMAICGGCLYDDTDVDQDTSHCQFPSQTLGDDPIQETYQDIVCRFCSQQSGVSQPLEDDDLF